MGKNNLFDTGLVFGIVILFAMSCVSVGGEHLREDRQFSMIPIHNFQDFRLLCTIYDGVIFESFEDGFGAWEADADSPMSWSVTETQEQSHHGAWSLNFTANGLLDDGTVWVVREISLAPGSWDIELEFYFWSRGSDVNNWQVIAYIGLVRPEFEEDFTIIGYAGIEGWSPYNYNETLVVEEQTTGWVALGYDIVYETWRTHYFDSVTISGLPPFWKISIPMSPS